MQGKDTLDMPQLGRTNSANPRPPLPTPITSSSVSPTKQHSYSSYPFPKKSRTTESTSEDQLEDSEDETSGPEKKLEQRREKNRIKQRNLRLRRQRHLDGLEKENNTLKAEVLALRKGVSDARQREENLHAWIRDLESALFSHGLSNDVDGLRRIWNGPPQQRGSADPLATLVQAAIASRPGTTPPVRPPSALSANNRRDSTEVAGIPYPTPSLHWESQQAPSWLEHGIKRKREDVLYAPAPPPHHHHSQSTFHHFANVPPLAPPALLHHSTSAPSGSTSRPSTAPHLELSPRISQTPRGSMQSGSIRISDLLSPLPSDQISEAIDGQLPDYAPIPYDAARRESTAVVERTIEGHNGSEGEDRRWSGGDLSVNNHSLSLSSGQFVTQMGKLRRQASTKLTGQNVPNINTFPLPQSIASTSSQTNTSFSHSLSQVSSQVNGYDYGYGQGHGNFGKPDFSQISVRPAITSTSSIASSAPHELFDPDVGRHPSILAARSFLLSILPSPLPLPLPTLPPLEPAMQRLVLLALTNLVPFHAQHVFHQRQLKYIPAEDARTLLQYQADPSADPRMILFPIAILRAKAVRHLMDGRAFDITGFVNHTLSAARIFGATLDPDAWEMPSEYWDVWEPWFPRGRSYCHSLEKWRRRDGEQGSTVVEMILGVEAAGARRTEPVGKPPNWTF